jgi:hypothetical protein
MLLSIDLEGYDLTFFVRNPFHYRLLLRDKRKKSKHGVFKPLIFSNDSADGARTFLSRNAKVK